MKQRKETPKSSDLPIYLFKQGNNQEAYRYFGAHLCEENGEAGAVFRVWAPHAKAVSIVGDFNSWTPGEHPEQPKRLVNVIKCTNPRCITSIEEGCDHIFALTPSGRYRCIYCEQEFRVKP